MEVFFHPRKRRRRSRRRRTRERKVSMVSIVASHGGKRHSKKTYRCCPCSCPGGRDGCHEPRGRPHSLGLTKARPGGGSVHKRKRERETRKKSSLSTENVRVGESILDSLCFFFLFLFARLSRAKRVGDHAARAREREGASGTLSLPSRHTHVQTAGHSGGNKRKEKKKIRHLFPLLTSRSC